MSRCSPKTGYWVWMSKREQEMFTRAFVRIAGKSRLTNSEHDTLHYFKRDWFSGNDFPYNPDKVGVLRRFVDICDKYKYPLEYQRRPAGGRGKAVGEMYTATWTIPEENGSCWPAYSKKETWEDRRRKKREFRIRIMHDEMKIAGIYEIDLYEAQAAKKAAAEKADFVQMPETKVIPAAVSNVVPIFKPKGLDMRAFLIESGIVGPSTTPYGTNDNARVAA